MDTSQLLRQSAREESESAMLSDFSSGLIELVFDSLGDIVYCVKDLDGVYQSVNLAFVARVNGTDKSDLLGKTASQVFSEPLAEGYEQQDRVVFETGRPIQDQLERITNSDGSIGWYLASKFPVHDRQGAAVGLVGISQDLNWPNDSNPELADLKVVVEFIKDNLDQSLKTEHLARQFSLSTVQLDRRMKRVFRLSTKKFIMKCRLEKASRQLISTEISVSDIALACGFTDQSALTRQFRNAISDTPANFRKKNQNS
ncbi:AraC family transcriptional regulator [Mariniblastus sp.]|nr:AraC family transcriptional regulator [Mariniblastus sp.]